MTAPGKRSAAEAWRVLEGMADADADEREWQRISALSDDELDRELAEGGIDPAESRARGEEVAREVVRLAAQYRPMQPARPARRRPSPRMTVLLLAAALAAVLIAAFSGAPGAIARWLYPEPRNIGPDVPNARPQPPPDRMAEDELRVHRAKTLRAAAHGDCAATRWTACQRELDEARALDPAGDATPEVQGDRAAAKAALTPKKAPSDLPDKPLYDQK